MSGTATPPIKHVTNRKSSKPKPLISSDVTPEQPADVDLGMPGEDVGFDKPDLSILHHPEKPEVVNADEQQLRNLAFEEEEVEIEISQEPGEHAPVDIFCGVNGKSIEMKIGDHWVLLENWARVGFPFITKRKYVGVLLRSRLTNVITVPDRADGSMPKNILRRNPSAVYVVQIIRDTPKGRDWAIKQLQQKG